MAEINQEEMEKVKKFMHDGCGCALGTKGSLCSVQFTEQAVIFNFNNCLQLSSVELDLVILASIQVFTHSKSTGKKRSRSPRCNFYYQSQPICKMFLRFSAWVIHDFDDRKNNTRITVSLRELTATPKDYRKKRYHSLRSKRSTHVKLHRGKCNLPSRKDTWLQKWWHKSSFIIRIKDESLMCIWHNVQNIRYAGI